MDTSRVLVLSPRDEHLFELAPKDVTSLVTSEAINRNSSIRIETTVKLQKEQRLLTADGMGVWREWVVSGEDRRHQEDKRRYGLYVGISSMQHDLQVCRVSRMPGVQTPVLAETALEAALSGTSRWAVGEVTQVTYGGASMYQMSSWQALSVLVKTWGGEIRPDIEVDQNGVVRRSVSLLRHMGKQEATRRFDYGRDLISIGRSVDESAMACRIVPRGRGEETGDGYGRKITIEDVNDGLDYLQNDESAELLKLPDGSGGWEYPTVYADNDQIDDPQELKDWGLSVLDDYTTPRVTYSATVEQLAEVGMDVKGIALGDEVQCVDLKFGGDGIRVSGRVKEVEIDHIDPSRTRVTIGYLGTVGSTVIGGISTQFASVVDSVSGLSQRATATEEYLDNLLDNLNAQINATGGYTYVTDGQGIRTYDVAVSDPLIGAEASQVVEVKGGNIRIANSRTSSGDWDWKTVLQSGHIAADLITSMRMETGYIGNPEGNVYINLDTNTFRFAALDALAGEVEGIRDGFDETAEELGSRIDDAYRYATDYLTYEDGELTLGATNSAVRNVMTSSRQAYRTAAGDIAWFGQRDDGVWEMSIDTASVEDMLRFNNFAWIARANGNMTLRWIGE